MASTEWPSDENDWLIKYDGTRYIPTVGQDAFHENKAVFRLLSGGRGSGKTAAGAQEAGRKIRAGEPGLIVGPDSEHFKKSTWPQLNEWLPIDPEHTGVPTSPLVDHWSKGEKYIRFVTGSQVWYGGIRDPDSWRGPNVNWVWFDEPGRHPSSKSFLILTGAMRVGNNPAMWLTTTPRGVIHWLYQVFVLRQLGEEVFDALEEAGMPRDPDLLLSWVRSSTSDNRVNLSPVYYAMLLATYQGKWRDQELGGEFVSFEGLVYDTYDPEIHLIDSIKTEPWWPRFLIVDFGYKNPFVAQWWVRNPDGDYFRYREIYYSQRTVREHAEQIKALSEGEKITRVICDHDAEDRATLEEVTGFDTEPAVKSIQPGIMRTYEMLEEKRLFLIRDALVERDPRLAADELPTMTEEEFPRYAWPENAEGKPRKEVPIDLHNHGMDATRYLVATIEGLEDLSLSYGANPLAGYRG